MSVSSKVSSRVSSHVSSMTGFARSEGEKDGVSWSWEVKSVNSKGLDIRCRLPSGYERLDVTLRERIQKIFRRGNIFANLTVSHSESRSGFQVNTAVLDAALAAVPAIMERFPNATPPSVDGLLRIRGVLEPVDKDDNEETKSALDGLVLAGLDDVLQGLKENREQEGSRMKDILSDLVATIQDLHGQALEGASTQAGLLRARIEQGITVLLETAPALPEERLAQEAAVLCTKADVREEIDRLQSHCKAAQDLLNEGGAIGRKFDFLCQEFNREANTLCSKAIDTDLTKVGLEMKVTIDQMREQVQNIE